MSSDQINTLDEMNRAFQLLLIDMLGYTKTGSPAVYSQDAFKAVRVSWPTGGAPAWKITEDVVFLKVTEEDDPYNRQRHVKYEDNGSPVILDGITTYTRAIQLALIVYGPNSWRNVQEIRDKMYLQDNRDYLKGFNLYMIPDVSAPIRFPEAFQGNWWERVDIGFKFYEEVVRSTTTQYITSAEIIVEDHEGIQADITID